MQRDFLPAHDDIQQPDVPEGIDKASGQPYWRCKIWLAGRQTVYKCTEATHGHMMASKLVVGKLYCVEVVPGLTEDGKKRHCHVTMPMGANAVRYWFRTSEKKKEPERPVQLELPE
jgi:hypothetical protein